MQIKFSTLAFIRLTEKRWNNLHPSQRLAVAVGKVQYGFADVPWRFLNANVQLKILNGKWGQEGI